MNILDGSWDCKVFQIGANQGQIMNVSIGSMGTKVLELQNQMLPLRQNIAPLPILFWLVRRQRGPSNHNIYAP